MAVKTVFTNEEFRDIFANYNLGEYINSNPISEGTVQTNYKVETTNGHFVFRYYENRTIDSVLFETHLLKFLKEHFYPCPDPYINNTGRYVGNYNSKPYVVFNYLEGRHIKELNEGQIKSLIQKIAELHKITLRYIPIQKESRWNYSVDFCLERAKEAYLRSNSQSLKDKYKWIEKGLLALELPNSIPKGVCHSDINTSNLLYNNNECVALLDFDDANYTYLLFDLVGLIESWAWNREKFSVLNLMEARKIIEEYTKHRPLNKQEKKHLFDVYKLSIFIDSVWFFERGDAVDFYEKKKIDYLDELGREFFYKALFN